MHDYDDSYERDNDMAELRILDWMTAHPGASYDDVKAALPCLNADMGDLGSVADRLREDEAERGSGAVSTDEF